MSDDTGGFSALFLVLFDEIHRAGESDLVDVGADLIGRHADAVVLNRQGTSLAVIDDIDAVGLILRDFGFAKDSQPLELGNGIGRIGDEFAQENILVGIQPFADDWEDILRVD